MSESLRIAFVLTASTGEIGRHVAGLVPRFIASGHRVRVYAPKATTETYDFAGGDVLPLAALSRLGSGDVLHAHGYRAGGLALPVRLVRRIPLVVTWYSAVLGLGRRATAARMLQRIVARGADLTLGASSDLVQQATWCGARRARLGPVAAPALTHAQRSRVDVRADLGIEASELLVLTVGRLAPQQNLGLLLDIAADVRSDGRLRFVVAGDGPQRAELEARIAADASRVQLLGRRDDVPDLLAAADVALLTSTWEARAPVAQQALLAGVPLVATRVGGIPELVGDGAVLFRLGDPRAAGRALRHLADLPFLRAELAARGRAEAATWPDLDEVAADMLDAYASVLRSR